MIAFALGQTPMTSLIGGSPVITIPDGLDAFIYINKADPGAQLVAGVSDSTGRWATGTLMANTKGSEDVTCPGLISSSGDAATLDKEAEAQSAVSVQPSPSAVPVQPAPSTVPGQRAPQRRRIAIAVAATLSLLLLLGLAVWGLFHLRKRKREAEVERAQTTPRRFIGPSRWTSNRAWTKLSTTSIHRSAKAMEVAAVENRSSNSAHSQDGIPTRSSGRRNSIIFQHQDAGSVRELPPPYIDRTLLSTELAE
ncbi:hypothetical protein CPC08DRAFT_69016 [Agrocybe pediades]|nr:hypothetical protein CPC08DRAFT_69016 [Agrocybe pediades]